GTKTAYGFGNDAGLLPYYGRHLQTGPAAGGLLRPNRRGLFDVHGNAWEWCQDWYQPRLVEAADPAGPPAGGARGGPRGGAGRPGGTAAPGTAAAPTATARRRTTAAPTWASAWPAHCRPAAERGHALTGGAGPRIISILNDSSWSGRGDEVQGHAGRGA